MEASIIIPTYNGGELLHKALKAIYAQKTTIEYEIVIIDEITNSSFNHGLTRDQAAAAATGKVLIFINQDAEPGDENWLDQMVKPFNQDESLLAVQGGIRERNNMQRFFWDSCGETFYFTSESKKWIARYHNMEFSTVNSAIRRSAWQQQPFGKMAIFEDKGFQRRVHHKGDEIIYGDGWVYHTHDYTYKQLRKRCQDEGHGSGLDIDDTKTALLRRRITREKKFLERIYQGCNQSRFRCEFPRLQISQISLSRPLKIFTFRAAFMISIFS